MTLSCYETYPMNSCRVVVLMISGASQEQRTRLTEYFIDFAKLNFRSMIKSSQARDTDVLDVEVWKIPAQYICKSRNFFLIYSMLLHMTQNELTHNGQYIINIQ